MKTHRISRFKKPEHSLKLFQLFLQKPQEESRRLLAYQFTTKHLTIKSGKKSEFRLSAKLSLHSRPPARKSLRLDGQLLFVRPEEDLIMEAQ